MFGVMVGHEYGGIQRQAKFQGSTHAFAHHQSVSARARFRFLYGTGGQIVFPSNRHRFGTTIILIPSDFQPALVEHWRATEVHSSSNRNEDQCNHHEYPTI